MSEIIKIIASGGIGYLLGAKRDKNPSSNNSSSADDFSSVSLPSNVVSDNGLQPAGSFLQFSEVDVFLLANKLIDAPTLTNYTQLSHIIKLAQIGHWVRLNVVNAHSNELVKLRAKFARSYKSSGYLMKASHLPDLMRLSLEGGIGVSSNFVTGEAAFNELNPTGRFRRNNISRNTFKHIAEGFNYYLTMSSDSEPGKSFGMIYQEQGLLNRREIFISQSPIYPTSDEISYPEFTSNVDIFVNPHYPILMYKIS